MREAKPGVQKGPKQRFVFMLLIAEGAGACRRQLRGVHQSGLLQLGSKMTLKSDFIDSLKLQLYQWRLALWSLNVKVQLKFVMA